MRHHTSAPARRPGWRTRLGALACAGALIAAACGDDDDDAEPADPADEITDTDETTDDGDAAPVDGTEGCGEGAVTDAADMSIDRAPARCEPGFPAPQPLDERASITVSTAFTAEFVAPLLLADHFGEFDAENIDVDIVSVSFSEALPQIATGRIDAAIGGAEAAWYNSVDQGIDVRWITGNFFVADAGDLTVPQTGLWARRDVFSDPDNPDLSEMEGSRLASAVGLGSTIAYPIAEAFADAGVSLLDLDIETVPSAEMVIALENEAVDAAWLLDPYWLEAAENDDFMLVATQTPGESLGGIFAGPRLYDEEPEVGEAFLRAMIRTINTHLDGDYKADPDVLSALSEVTEIPEENLAATPALVFDWEIREGTTERTQGYFIEFGTVEFDEPIPEDELVDRSLYLAAVGHDQ